tara:strand:+ start:4618 stop:5244 length:627 start_codon:yes stop_codon:yes gene_type:complete
MAVTGALAMQAVGGVLSSIAGARAAKQQAALNIAKWRESEVLRAKDWANATWFQLLEEEEKWARNQAIGEEALKIREKNRYWQRERTNNTMSQMSNGMFKAYGDLQGQLAGRMNSNSATSKAMLRNAMSNYHKARDTVNVNSALEKGLIDDEYQKTLNMRDFGFTKISEITPGQYYGQSPSQAYSSALMSGIGQTTMAVAGSYYQANT